MNEAQSKDYLTGLQNGDEATIFEMYQQIFPKVRTFILNNKGSRADAQETFQEALYQLSLRLKIKDIDIKSSFEAYLFTVCKNLWRRELNKNKKWVRNDEVIARRSEEEYQNDAIIAQERWDLFELKIEELSENCRLLLKEYFKKTPYGVIVDQFNYSSENVAFQRVFKCKKKLIALIKNDTKYRELL